MSKKEPVIPKGLTIAQKIEHVMRWLKQVCRDIELHGPSLKLDLAKHYKAEVIQLFQDRIGRYDYTGWVKMIGVVKAPSYGKGAQIHIFMIAEGPLAELFDALQPMQYDEESALLLNKFFGFDLASKRRIGQMHVHVIPYGQLKEFSTAELIKIIDSKHSYILKQKGVKNIQLQILDRHNKVRNLYNSDLAELK